MGQFRDTSKCCASPPNANLMGTETMAGKGLAALKALTLVTC